MDRPKNKLLESRLHFMDIMGEREEVIEKPGMKCMHVLKRDKKRIRDSLKIKKLMF